MYKLKVRGGRIGRLIELTKNTPFTRTEAVSAIREAVWAAKALNKPQEEIAKLERALFVVQQTYHFPEVRPNEPDPQDYYYADDQRFWIAQRPDSGIAAGAGVLDPT
jgi:hypothetical protein